MNHEETKHTKTEWHLSSSQLLPIHAAQLLTYLKLRNCRLGFLLNWNVKLMKDGIKRMVNHL